jgi:SAM-dependent methyltransferase
MEKPDYGNWVPLKYIYITGILAVLFLLTTYIYSPIIVVSLILFIITAYFAYARNRFSPEGGDIQSKIRELVLNNLNWHGNGRMIDIGCGNAPLTINAAKKYPNALVTGIDYWGGMWEYSINVCKENAGIEGVADRITFQKTTASDLPFKDGYFDAAVSNLVFHEVNDTKDKRDVIKEALRVVKKGGVFSFQDLFHDKRIYGDIEDLIETIKNWDIEKVEFLSTKDSGFIPGPLKLPFMVGTIGIIHGIK